MDSRSRSSVNDLTGVNMKQSLGRVGSCDKFSATYFPATKAAFSLSCWASNQVNAKRGRGGCGKWAWCEKGGEGEEHSLPLGVVSFSNKTASVAWLSTCLCLNNIQPTPFSLDFKLEVEQIDLWHQAIVVGLLFEDPWPLNDARDEQSLSECINVLSGFVNFSAG